MGISELVLELCMCWLDLYSY